MKVVARARAPAQVGMPDQDLRGGFSFRTAGSRPHHLRIWMRVRLRIRPVLPPRMVAVRSNVRPIVRPIVRANVRSVVVARKWSRPRLQWMGGCRPRCSKGIRRGTSPYR